MFEVSEEGSLRMYSYRAWLAVKRYGVKRDRRRVWSVKGELMFG